MVLNAPAARHVARRRGVRAAGPPDAAAGIGADVPLLVYSGAAAPQRGLDTIVEALPQLPDGARRARGQRADRPVRSGAWSRARPKLGVADRVHVLPYVPHWQVVAFLSAADVGVIPIHHWPNHEIALITKFFEYSHARLPIVVSDVRTMAETVRVNRAGRGLPGRGRGRLRPRGRARCSPTRSATAPRTSRPGLLASWTWEAQAEMLDGVYTRLLPGRPPRETRTRCRRRSANWSHRSEPVEVRT